MKTVEFGFAVSSAVLQSCVSGGAESLDWIELQMHAPEDQQVLCDEHGRTLGVSQWHMSVNRAIDTCQANEAL